MHSGKMKVLFLLALSALPVWSEVRDARVDVAGVVSVDWGPEQTPVQSLVLEGRNSPDQSWETLQIWNLEAPTAGMQLQTPPHSARAEYRVLRFGENGYSGQSPVVAPPPSAETVSFYRRM